MGLEIAMEPRVLEVGDVVQIDPEHDPRFGGCLMMVTERKSWGAQGFVAIPHADGPQNAYYRCKYKDMEYVGRASWIPEPTDVSQE